MHSGNDLFVGFGYHFLRVPALELPQLQMEKEPQSRERESPSQMVQKKYPGSCLAGATGERPKYTFLVVFELISPRKPPVGLLGGEGNTRIQRV